MAEVVIVHGAFHEMWGPFRLGFRWAPPMMDGLWAAGVDVHAVSLEQMHRAVTVAFWGDLVRPTPRPASEVMAQLSGDDDAGLAGLASRFESDGPKALDHIGRAMAAEANKRSTELLGQYFTDPDLRAAIHGRLERHLGPDTKVVVAHSMGTVIAYQVLCAHPELQVQQFITLGSPLGTPGLVLDRLDPPPVDGRGVWPASVTAWANVAAEGDLATMAAPALAPVFGEELRDSYVFNGRHPHDIEGYLTAAQTGAALADGLGVLRSR
jgi:pimeloyl-ACP methyl ester carboxylesterase